MAVPDDVSVVGFDNTPLSDATTDLTTVDGLPDVRAAAVDMLIERVGDPLRSVGYDGTLNIEHEDTLLASVEGVSRAAALLRQVVPVEPADWKPADI